MIARKITFDEKEHKYRDEKNDNYVSVTTVISEYEEKFDTVPEAIKYAKKHGGTPEYWIDQWAKTNKIACDNGNYHHDGIEGSVKKISITPEDLNTVYKIKASGYTAKISLVDLNNSPIKDLYPLIYNRLIELINAGFVLYAEKIVYWAEYYIAGKIDLIAIRGKDVIILDWKTNKDELKFTSGYYKKVDGVKTNIWIEQDKRFKYPISHLQQCKGNIYTLQLSLYARIIEEFGFNILSLEIYHIRPDGIKPYLLTYLKNDVEQMALHHYNKKTNLNKKVQFGIF